MPLKNTLRSAALVTVLGMTQVRADVPIVVADTAIAHSFAAQVMEGVGTPRLVLTQGADPHSFQLRLSQMRDLARADLIVWTAQGLTPWMERAVAGLEAPVLELITAQDLETRAFGDTDHGEHDSHEGDDAADHSQSNDNHDDHDDGGLDYGDHGGAHEAGHSEDHNHTKHGHVGLDPHFWLDPQNAGPVLSAIATQLAEMDPENAPTYLANAARWQAEAATLEADLASALSPALQTELIFFHDAYGYLTRAFGLSTLGTIRQGDAAAPGAQQLATLRALGSQPACLFPEAAHPETAVATLVEGTRFVAGAPLDPAGVLETPGPGLYGATLRAIATAISDCARALDEQGLDP